MFFILPSLPDIIMNIYVVYQDLLTSLYFTNFFLILYHNTFFSLYTLLPVLFIYKNASKTTLAVKHSDTHFDKGLGLTFVCKTNVNSEVCINLFLNQNVFLSSFYLKPVVNK